ncbi:MAG TPA: NUDIX hydrolase [Jiangellaceae bacterium]
MKSRARSGGSANGDPIVAAGAVLWRETTAGSLEICLVHRPKYDDWSLPKGKLEPGEHILACAVREVAEETGHHVVLGRPLPTQRYTVDGRPKLVRYWAARTDGDVPRRPDREVDELTFLPAAEALDRLTHPRDADVVSSLVTAPIRTTPLVLVRHAKAVHRASWDGSDAERPLDDRGRDEAVRLAAPLNALGVDHAVSSDAVRCVDTLRPWAAAAHVTLGLEPAISEEGFELTGDERTAQVVRDLTSTGPAVICSHRPVLPSLLRAAGVDPGPPLQTGEFVVVHHRGGLVVAVERHEA